MKMSMTTNYAIRIIAELSIENKLSASDLSRMIGIPIPSIMKIMDRLKTAGLIQVHRGVDGGFVLKRRSQSITLYELIKVVESTIYINRCLEDDKYCSRCAVEYCEMRKLYEQTQEKLEEELKRYTIRELITQRLER